MTVITIWSESGGVGKTTTTLNLAAALGKQGMDVLIVDLDPQPASITDYAGRQRYKEGDVSVTMTDALLSDEHGLKDIILADELFDLAPAHSSLASLESTVRAKNISTGEFLLRSELEAVKDDYNFVLIDPPATLNLLVDNALIASGNVLIPMEMTRKGERSIVGVLDTVTAMESQLQRAQPDFSLDVMGVLPNKVDGSRLNQEIQALLDEEFDNADVLPVTIPDYNVLEESWDAGLDIFRYAEHDEYGVRSYQESLLEAYNDLAEFVIEGQDGKERVVA